MELELIRGIWDYHGWDNHTLFTEATALGEETAWKELGAHWSFPTVKTYRATVVKR